MSIFAIFIKFHYFGTKTPTKISLAGPKLSPT